jgi:hypothetical protein
LPGGTRSALAAAALLAVGVAACGEALLEYREDFSNPEQGAWSRERTRSALFEYADGRYRIGVTRPGKPEVSSIVLPQPFTAMRVEVDVVEERGSGDETLYGVACGAGRRARYFIGINRRGAFLIEEQGVGEPLAEARTTRRYGTQGSAVRLAAECRVDDDDARLSLEVNSRRVTGAVDEGAEAGGFDRVSLFVATPNAGTEVGFDNLVVREL